MRVGRWRLYRFLFFSFLRECEASASVLFGFGSLGIRYHGCFVFFTLLRTIISVLSGVYYYHTTTYYSTFMNDILIIVTTVYKSKQPPISQDSAQSPDVNRNPHLIQ